MSAGSAEDLDDIIDEICNDSSFTKTPPVSRGLQKFRASQVQQWKWKHHKLKLLKQNMNENKL